MEVTVTLTIWHWTIHLPAQEHITQDKTNVQDSKDTTGLGNHLMVRDPHYTGDDSKLHTGQDTGEDRACIDLTPTAQWWSWKLCDSLPSISNEI